MASPAQTPSTPPPADTADDGPFVTLLNTFANDTDSPFGRLRQILAGAFGCAFLTAAGFIGATWRSRREAAMEHGRRRSPGRRAQNTTLD